MVNFTQAIKWLQQGKKIKRPIWSNDSYWTLGIDDVLLWADDTTAKVHLDQINAKDWEIYLKKDYITTLNKSIKNYVRDFLIRPNTIKLSYKMLDKLKSSVLPKNCTTGRPFTILGMKIELDNSLDDYCLIYYKINSMEVNLNG